MPFAVYRFQKNHIFWYGKSSLICVPIKLTTSCRRGSFLFYTNKEAESSISEKSKIFSAFADHIPDLIEAFSVIFVYVILSPFYVIQRSCKLKVLVRKSAKECCKAPVRSCLDENSLSINKVWYEKYQIWYRTIVLDSTV